MRKINWSVTENEVSEYAKDVLELEITDWQLLHVMDKIELALEKLVKESIEEIVSEDE